VEEQAQRLRAARRGADAAGVAVFVNARTDLFLAAPRDAHDDARATLAIERARAYADAGADGFFVPGLVDLRLIARIVEGTALPVNVMMAKGLPSRRELCDAGVARISHGPGPYRQLMEQLTAAARQAIGEAP
jgi:methylisocitrate lyase